MSWLRPQPSRSLALQQLQKNTQRALRQQQSSRSRAPSTSAAQPIAAPSTGVGIVGERPTNMASFSSVPLGSLVDPKVKAKIWAGQFVELDTLVGEFSESPVLIFDTKNRNPSVQMRVNVSRRIFNVAQWTDAFLVYVAIYTECHPTYVASILKYVQLVRSMAASARNNMFIAYDRDFSKLPAHNNMPWDVIHQELYLALSYRNQNVSHNPRHTQGNNGKQPFRGGGGLLRFCVVRALQT